MYRPAHAQPRTRGVVAHAVSSPPRPCQVSPASAQQAVAYRRLAIAILGLDLSHLGAELRSARTALERAA